MKRNTFKIHVPFFMGYYESVLFNSDTEYQAIREDIDYLREQYGEDKTPDDFEIDFDAYTHDCNDAYIDAFKDVRPDFVSSVELDRMVSPKYYNYSTDRLIASITMDDDWREQMLAFMDENRDKLAEQIMEDWTDRDGFWSFLSNDFDYWRKEVAKDEPDERYIEALIAYYMLNENKDVRWLLAVRTLENVYVGSYIRLIETENA